MSANEFDDEANPAPAVANRGAEDVELSRREYEVLQMAADGLTDKSIALRLGLSEGTLRVYWERTRVKLHAKSRAQAIARLLRREYGKTEDKLLSEVARMQLFFANLTDFGALIMDPDGLIQTANIGFERIFGYQNGDLIGKHFEVIFRPEDRAAGLPAEQLQRARDEGPVPENHRHCRKNGEHFDADGTLFGLWDHEFYGYGKIIQETNKSGRRER